MANVKIGKIRMDNEFTVSAKFTAFCMKRDMVLCPSVSYTQTMQVLAEGAVCICKEHVRCLLKASNAPARFWPFALLHFCRTYNYWPGSNSLPPWESMNCSNFNFDITCNLHQYT